MLDSILVFAVLIGPASIQVPESAQTCHGVEATLRVIPNSFRRGAQARFAVVLKNGSEKPVRLLDVRNGRRPDLAHSYYEITFEQNGRPLKNLPRAISDPGPLDAADFFVLSPGATVEAPLTTPADLRALPSGQYSAHVRITLDPFSESTVKCRSARTAFTINK